MGLRRPRGEGSVYRRPDGRWSGQVTVGWEEGRQLRKTIYGSTRKEVQDRVRAILREVDTGSPPPTRSPKLAQFVERWLEADQASLAPSTHVSYQGTLRLHVNPVIGHVPLDKLTVDHIAKVLRSAQDNPRLSTRSARYVIQVLRIALNDARRWGLVSRNVAELLKLPKQARRDVRVLDPAEARRLIDACRTERLGPLVVVTMGTGMRLGEVLGLQWDNVDLDRRQLRVSQKLSRIRGVGLVLSDTKSAHGRRSIFLPHAAAEALRRERDLQRLDRSAAGSVWLESNFVFTTANGTPLDQSNVRRPFGRILREANLPRLRIHDLRHSCASLLLAEGVPPRVVMEVLGHSRISVTMDTYSHVMPALVKDAADAIDRSLGSNLER